MYGYEAPERREEVGVHLELDKDAADRYPAALRDLRVTDAKIKEGDTLKVTWRFEIAYYGGVARALGAVHDLVSDESIVRHVNVQELRHGQSVILEVAAKLTRLIDKLEGKPSPEPPKRKRFWPWDK